MLTREQLMYVGFVLGLFTSVIGAFVFNYFYFRKLDEKDYAYTKYEKWSTIAGSIFGTAVTAAVVLLVIDK